jgi:hypothetical protein
MPRPKPEPRIPLTPHEAERIRLDVAEFSLARCAAASGLSPDLLVRAAAMLPLRLRDVERIRAAIHTFTPRGES